MAQCLPAESVHGIPGHPGHMQPGIVGQEQHTLAIQQCWLLLMQCLLHMFQLLRVQVRSDGLVRW